MLINLKSLSSVLVMISSMSVPICNRVHATRDNCGKITTFRLGVCGFLLVFHCNHASNFHHYGDMGSQR